MVLLNLFSTTDYIKHIFLTLNHIFRLLKSFQFTHFHKGWEFKQLPIYPFPQRMGIQRRPFPIKIATKLIAYKRGGPFNCMFKRGGPFNCKY